MCIFIWCVVSCRCCAHFRPISCAISRPFPNIHPSHVALLFNPKSSPICFCSQFKAHTSSPSSVALLSLHLVYPLLLSLLSDLGSFAMPSFCRIVVTVCLYFAPGLKHANSFPLVFLSTMLLLQFSSSSESSKPFSAKLWPGCACCLPLHWRLRLTPCLRNLAHLNLHCLFPRR